MTNELIETDVLILGSGIAGLATALELARSSPTVRILVVTRAHRLTDSNTRYAQGGIIAKGGEDLVADILQSGDGISKPAAARVLASVGPKAVQTMLVDIARVPFDRAKSGELQFGLEGGHSEARVAKVADATGKAIEECLVGALAEYPSITVLRGVTAVDLLLSDGCVGAYGLDHKSGRVLRLLAKKTVLATGGAGQIYASTTNPTGARGDGFAMAYRAGARLAGMEFVQFHPTALAQPGAPPFLISEAVRGEGARLTDAHGKPFMQKYYPALKAPDLATRDKVSRAIFAEMQATGVSHVYLDLRSTMKKAEIKRHFPTIYKTCLTYGVDITTDLIPVAPAAHYMCGGVVTDLWGRTSIKNLYAVGEVANTGLHGGNRLASTSLLEGLVFGMRAARDMASCLDDTRMPDDASAIASWTDNGSFEPDTARLAVDMATIQHIMWDKVGLVRKGSLLKQAVADLTKLEGTITRGYRGAKLTDALLGVRNAATTALLVARSAQANTQSIGCHYREN